MNNKKVYTIVFLVLIQFPVHGSDLETGQALIGTWTWAGNNQYSVLDLDFFQADSDYILGTYIFVTQGGNRINSCLDGDPPPLKIPISQIKTGEIRITVPSCYWIDRTSAVSLELKDGKLYWSEEDDQILFTDYGKKPKVFVREDISINVDGRHELALGINEDGLRSYRSKDYDTAVNYFLNAYALNNENTEILGNLAITYIKLNKNEKAIWSIKKLINISSDAKILASAYYNWGLALRKSKPEQAKEKFQISLDYYPSKIVKATLSKLK